MEGPYVQDRISLPWEKRNFLKQLEKEILPLQGLKHANASNPFRMRLGAMQNSFPNLSFPTGAMHEFQMEDPPGIAATTGFISALLSGLMKNGGVTAWISRQQHIFPPALKFFGIEPDRIIFIHPQKEKQILWAIEETLKCESLSAVVGEIKEISFIASRRLQLAVEQTGVTGFILRPEKNITPMAAVARWKISSLPSEFDDDMPGPAFPRWNVQLLKIRNGKPGQWQIEWATQKFQYLSPDNSVPQQKRKTG